MNLPRLSDAVTPVLGLRVHGRVPIAVVKNDRVCSGQIDPDPTTSRRQNKEEDTLVIVKTLHQNLALLHLRRSIQSEISVSVDAQENF
jgi:hypothetical protein